MLYKFKSQATGDLIMLEPNGRQILKIIGRHDKQSLAQGIIRPPEMPAVIVALHAAVDAEEAQLTKARQEALDRGETLEPPERISLRQRATPFIDMLKRCIAEDQDLVWGV
ncbi:MAG: DUF1840 domain-containing protein [Rhodoferax sp.]|nr:DUF1840 domain-containing protein [Rhodoferax sp.]